MSHLSELPAEYNGPWEDIPFPLPFLQAIDRYIKASPECHFENRAEAIIFIVRNYFGGSREEQPK